MEKVSRNIEEQLRNWKNISEILENVLRNFENNFQEKLQKVFKKLSKHFLITFWKIYKKHYFRKF